MQFSMSLDISQIKSHTQNFCQSDIDLSHNCFRDFQVAPNENDMYAMKIFLFVCQWYFFFFFVFFAQNMSGREWRKEHKFWIQLNNVYWINMKHNIFLHQIQKYLHFCWLLTFLGLFTVLSENLFFKSIKSSYWQLYKFPTGSNLPRFWLNVS